MKKNILALAVGTALVAGTTGASSLPELKAPNPHTNQRVAVEATYNKDAFANAVKVGENKISVIIQLEDAPLALFEPANPALSAKSNTSAKLADNLKGSSAKEYASYLRSKQNSFVTQAKQVDTSFKSKIRYDSLLNGMSATVDKDKVHQLAQLPGVKAVFPDTKMYAQMDRSLDIVRAKEVWESLGGSAESGKGVKVAIVDGGIRPENPLFSDEGFTAPEGLPTDDYCSTVDESFCNNKLIVARAATVSEDEMFRIYEDEYPNSPLAFNGHGVHVAGTAVGNWNVTATLSDGSTETIGGVAPGAYLMAYKGLYTSPDNPASGSGQASWLIEMMEAAVEDGADIINNSWGSSAAVAAPIYEEVFLAAKAAGSTMVFAAGNDGPGDGTIGSPATSKHVLTVGGSTTSRYQINQFSVADAGVNDAFSIVSGPVAVDSDITAPIIYAGNVAEDNFEGCNAYEDAEAFAGAMALISRGSCFFADKVANAQAAGAAGVIVFNSNPGEAPFAMGGLDEENQTIPSAMISYENGIAVAEYLATAEAETSATLTASVSVQDAMYQASSRGPNADSDILKPNLLAPGQQILSGESPVAVGNEGQDFSIKSGTSMASPHVAGAAAIIKQLHPEWTPDQIMSAVTHTAVRDTLIDFDLTNELTPFDIGAGRLDVVRATQAELTFSELGLASSDCYQECSWTVTVTNTTDGDITVDVTESIMGTGYELDVTPGDATLAAGSETELTVTVNAIGAQTLDTWVFGSITWDDGNSETPEYYMPLAVNAISADSPTLLNSSTDSSTAEAGSTVTLDATISNTSLADAIELKATFDDRLTVDTASVTAAVSGEAQSTSYNAEENSVTWTGMLEPASFTIEEDSQPADELALFGITSYFSMADFGAAPLTCSATCDDSFVTVTTGSPISYLGEEYSTIHVSSNGFVVLGDDSTGANFSQTQELPSVDAPNNVVAPLWMDLDLAGGDGAGELYATDLNLSSDFGCGEFCSDYYIVEWRGAEIYQAPGESYTFQLWFEKGTDNAYFYYGEVGSYPEILNQFGLGLTVGAENKGGNVGITSTRIASDGTQTGTLPAAGDIVRLSAGTGGSLAFSANATLAERGAVIADTLELTEDTSATSAVLDNDLNRAVVTDFVLTSGATSARSYSTVNYDFPSLDTTTLAVTEGPTNGSAEVNADGSISYSPTANYFGSDSFTYSVTDADGVVNTAEVSVTVNGVDDEPTMSVNAPASTVEGHFFDVVVTANDVDGDDLTVTINGTETSSLRVLAPEVDSAGTQLTYDVTVSDGTTTLESSVSVTVNDAPEGSGGSLAWYSLLLLPLTWLRRRKTH
ncbi:MAG: S8 family serine peptidase [Aestuariibacter sp.]